MGKPGIAILFVGLLLLLLGGCAAREASQEADSTASKTRRGGEGSTVSSVKEEEDSEDLTKEESEEGSEKAEGGEDSPGEEGDEEEEPTLAEEIPTDEETVDIAERKPPVLLARPEWVTVACRPASPKPLGAVDVVIVYDSSIVRLIDVVPTLFQDKPDRHTVLVDQSPGRVRIVAYHVDADGPREKVQIARLRFEAVEAGEARIAGELKVLADIEGTSLPGELILNPEAVTVGR